MVRQYHWLRGQESEQTLGDSEGQGSLARCSPWGCKESDMTQCLNNNNLPYILYTNMHIKILNIIIFSVISLSLLVLMSFELVLLSNHLILCHPLLFLPSIFPSIRFFSNESALHIRWPKYWSFSCSISPSNEYSGLISLKISIKISLQSKGILRVFSSTTIQKHQFIGVESSLWSRS